VDGWERSEIVEDEDEDEEDMKPSDAILPAQDGPVV
jgi:hypothetical protein